MEEEDREMTAFVTQGGLFKFKVMPFGVMNTQVTFKRLMATHASSAEECMSKKRPEPLP